MEIKINKEIRDYQESVFMGLSLRQFLFSLLAVGVAIGIYFAIYTAKQIAGTIFIATGVSTSLFDDIEKFIVNNLRLSAHLGFCIFALIELILGTVYFLVTRNMMKKKLNLE